MRTLGFSNGIVIALVLVEGLALDGRRRRARPHGSATEWRAQSACRSGSSCRSCSYLRTRSWSERRSPSDSARCRARCRARRCGGSRSSISCGARNGRNGDPMSTSSKPVAVTAMNLRSVVDRRATALVAIVGIAGVVAVLIGIFSINEGFRAVLEQSGADDVAIVLRGGGTDEMTSGLSQQQTRMIGDAAGVLHEGGRPVSSAELYVIVDVPLKSTGTPANVPLRGVGPRPPKPAARISLARGPRCSRPAPNEVIVGRGAADSSRGSRSARNSARARTSGISSACSRTRAASRNRRSGPMRSVARRVQPRHLVSVDARAPRERGRAPDVQGRAHERPELTCTCSPSASITRSRLARSSCS